MLKENKQKLIEGKLLRNNNINIPIRSPSLPSNILNSSFNGNSNINYNMTNKNNTNLINNNVPLNLNTNLNNLNNIQNQINNNIEDNYYNHNIINSNDSYKHVRDLPSDSFSNVNIISHLDDPYSVYQQQSLSDFKKVLSMFNKLHLIQ